MNVETQLIKKNKGICVFNLCDLSKVLDVINDNILFHVGDDDDDDV